MLFLHQPKVIRKKIRKIHRRKINKLCKDHEKYDMFITLYCHGDEMNQRKFSSLKMFNIMHGNVVAKFQHHNFHEKEIVDPQTIRELKHYNCREPP